MRQVCWSFSLVALLGSSAACGDRLNVQCETDTNCNLTTGGVCAAAPTGNHWCAYPDPACPSGYRFSDVDVGDGVARQCVAATDAGVDAPPDRPDGDTSCRLRVAFVDGKPPFAQSDDGSGRRQVWIANPDGTGMINLSADAGNDSAHPSWSPDGIRVAFASNLTGKYDIFVVYIDSGGLTNLTSGAELGSSASYPVWSPDGTRIAFVYAGNVWVMNANGTGASQISTLIVDITRPLLAWSPDSRQLVFGVFTPPSTRSLYVATIGSSAMPLKINSGNVRENGNSWAPSAKITFDNGLDILTVNGDGTNLINVTQDPANMNAGAVAFNNGSTIVFSSSRSGYREVWSMPASGGNATQITQHTLSPLGDRVQDVSSDGRLLAFARLVQTVLPDFSVVETSQLGVSNIDGTDLQLFNAPGLSNAIEAKFSTCPEM